MAGGGGYDAQPGSQVLLAGALPVHGLYAALAALPWCGGPEQPDVPLLAAPVPFPHAALVQLRFEVRRQAGRQAAALLAGWFVGQMEGDIYWVGGLAVPMCVCVYGGVPLDSTWWEPTVNTQ
jgi:hypothetical protein